MVWLIMVISGCALMLMFLGCTLYPMKLHNNAIFFMIALLFFALAGALDQPLTAAKPQEIDMSTFKIEIGKQVTDNITDFKGMVTARCEYITGCMQYLVTPKGKPTKIEDSHWLDEDRVLSKAEIKKRKVGGPQQHPATIK